MQDLVLYAQYIVPRKMDKVLDRAEAFSKKRKTKSVRMDDESSSSSDDTDEDVDGWEEAAKALAAARTAVGAVGLRRET